MEKPTPEQIRKMIGGAIKGHEARLHAAIKETGEINPTLQECKDAGIFIGITEQQSKEFYEHYKPQGWNWGNGQPMCPPLQDCLVRWRNNQYKFEKQSVKTKLFPIKGKTCSQSGCGMPAVYKDTGGDYDFYSCEDHLPDKVRKKYV